jgi:SDR family mycofactocin-dependent oxidoreductase
MVNRVKDKVALVTGAARGQGRSHAVKLAEEGADIILVDVCQDVEHNGYSMATPRDLEEAQREVEKTGQRAASFQVDVRDRAALTNALNTAIEEFGHLDVVVANAGICPLGTHLPVEAFATAFDVDFIGVVNTVHAALPHLREGASVITIGSVAAVLAEKAGAAANVGPQGTGGTGYNLAKQFIDKYTFTLASQLAPLSIRANVVHPTNCNTDMLHHEGMYKIFRPDLDHPSREDAMLSLPMMQSMPVPYIEPEDVSNAVCFLASDESRFVTGLRLTVDAGACLKI